MEPGAHKYRLPGVDVVVAVSLIGSPPVADKQADTKMSHSVHANESVVHDHTMMIS